MRLRPHLFRAIIVAGWHAPARLAGRVPLTWPIGRQNSPKWGMLNVRVPCIVEADIKCRQRRADGLEQVCALVGSQLDRAVQMRMCVWRWLSTRRSRPGQGMVEFTLVIPLFVLFVFGIIQVALIYQANAAITQAASDVAHVTATQGDSDASNSQQTYLYWQSDAPALAAAETALSTQNLANVTSIEIYDAANSGAPVTRAITGSLGIFGDTYADARLNSPGQPVRSAAGHGRRSADMQRRRALCPVDGGQPGGKRVTRPVHLAAAHVQRMRAPLEWAAI